MKIAVGCLVQWYECNIVGLFFESLRASIDKYAENFPKEDILLDILVCTNQDLEKAITLNDLDYCIKEIKKHAQTYGIKLGFTNQLVTIADYRRVFNEGYCDQVDVLVWGESDSLMPQQALTCIRQLHESVQETTPKYVATFASCKMWDDSWKPLEHPEFTDKPFIEGDTINWWSLRYAMALAEMNVINDMPTELLIRNITPHKFNGCGLVISSEVIKAGVNIPRSIFFIHEDTAFNRMLNTIIPNAPQYHFSNILMVHNRKHPLKRTRIAGEEGLDPTNPGLLREQHAWYEKANRLCEQNAYNFSNPSFKAHTWKDVLN